MNVLQEVESLFEDGQCAGLCGCLYAENDGFWYALFETRHDALLAYQYISVNRATLRGALIMVRHERHLSLTEYLRHFATFIQ